MELQHTEWPKDLRASCWLDLPKECAQNWVHVMKRPLRSFWAIDVLNEATRPINLAAMPVSNPQGPSQVIPVVLADPTHGTPRDTRSSPDAAQAGSGSALVHLISSMQTLERTAATPGICISVSIRNRDSAGRSVATTFST